MGILSKLGRMAKRGGADLMERAGPALGTGLFTGATSGLVAGMGGGSPSDVGNAFLAGAAGGMGGGLMKNANYSALPAALGVAAGLTSSTMTTRDLDDAARKVLQHTGGDPANIERVTDLLLGVEDYAPEEIYQSGKFSRNVYGIGGIDEGMMRAKMQERDAVIRRAKEMAGYSSDGMR